MPFANGNANMARTYDMDGSESGSISERMDKKKKIAMLPHEYESIQRQYGNKKYGEYTIEDKKNVINYYKKQKKGKVWDYSKKEEVEVDGIYINAKAKEGRYGIFGNINLNFIEPTEQKKVSEYDDIPF